MKNVIKIVCDSFMNRVSYFFLNELDEWLLLSGSSPLSSQHYTKADIKNISKDIVEKIDEVYNRKNKGVDILFEGTTDNYECICRDIEEYLPGRNITCRMKTTKIAVVGKKKTGKTSLINGIAKSQGYKLKAVEESQYTKYKDEHNPVEWFEVNGIDLGNEKVEEVCGIIRELVYEGLSKVIYCISGDSGRIEKSEKNMIITLKKTFPSIDVLTAVTKCYKDGVQKVIDEIEKTIGQGEVFPTLAKEYKARNGGIVEPFGLTELSTFVFEGKRLPKKLSEKLLDSPETEEYSEFAGNIK